MRRLLFLLIFIQMTCLLFGQVNVYTMNNGSAIQSREEVWEMYERCYEMNKNPNFSGADWKKMYTEPIIYHRITRGDTIINFYEIRSYFVENETEMAKDFIFEQDPSFLLIGQKFPDFNLKDINGNSFTSDRLKGKPTLINLNGTYCKPCLEEIPSLNKLKEKYQDKVNFISIFDVEKKRGDIESILKSRPFNFKILKDNANFKSQLGIKRIPKNIFIDNEGIVRYIQRKYDYKTDRYFDKILDELTEKQ